MKNAEESNKMRNGTNMRKSIFSRAFEHYIGVKHTLIPLISPGTNPNLSPHDFSVFT